MGIFDELVEEVSSSTSSIEKIEKGENKEVRFTNMSIEEVTNALEEDFFNAKKGIKKTFEEPEVKKSLEEESKKEKETKIEEETEMDAELKAMLEELEMSEKKEEGLEEDSELKAMLEELGLDISDLEEDSQIAGLESELDGLLEELESLEERNIIKLDNKTQKKRMLIKKAIKMAFVAKDPLYAKYKVVAKKRKELMTVIVKKYLSRAKSSK